MLLRLACPVCSSHSHLQATFVYISSSPFFLHTTSALFSFNDRPTTCRLQESLVADALAPYCIYMNVVRTCLCILPHTLFLTALCHTTTRKPHSHSPLFCICTSHRLSPSLRYPSICSPRAARSNVLLVLVSFNAASISLIHATYPGQSGPSLCQSQAHVHVYVETAVASAAQCVLPFRAEVGCDGGVVDTLATQVSKVHHSPPLC